MTECEQDMYLLSFIHTHTHTHGTSNYVSTKTYTHIALASAEAPLGSASHVPPSVIPPPTGPGLHKVTSSQGEVRNSPGQLKEGRLTASPNQAEQSRSDRSFFFCERVCIAGVYTRSQASTHKHRV